MEIPRLGGLIRAPLKVYLSSHGGFLVLDLKFDYGDCVARSEQVEWTLDDVMEEGQPLDFTRPFLPAALVGHLDSTKSSVLSFAAETRRGIGLVW